MIPNTKDAILLQDVAVHHHLLDVMKGFVGVVQIRQWIADETVAGTPLTASRTEGIRPHLHVAMISVVTGGITRGVEVTA
jgi:hypothetical protein